MIHHRTSVRKQDPAGVDVLLREARDRLCGPRGQADDAAVAAIAIAAIAIAAISVVGQDEGDVGGARVRVHRRCDGEER